MSRGAPCRPPLPLDKLGWRQFDDLCAGLLELDAGIGQEEWAGGEGTGSFVRLADGLALPTVGRLAGPCHVQTAWLPRWAGEGRVAALGLALADLRRRVAEEEGTLVVLSNVGADSFPAGQGADGTVTLLGPEWISARVDALPELRVRLPSLLSLDGVDRWMDGDIRASSTLDLAAAHSLAEVFVPTGAYGHALAVLRAHRFAVLAGPPEMGKTSIARMIALALMSDGWEAHECTTPEQLMSRFDAGRPQVFVADDAFGSTEYRPDSAERWARAMERLLRLMDDRHWLIWTSRPAPLHAGLRRIHRERGAERFPQPGAVLVDAASLRLDEKVLIVLRHGMAAAPPEVRRRLQGVGYEIVSHPHFTPERIRRLLVGDAHLLAARWTDQRVHLMIDRHLQMPTEAMATSFRALDEEHRALLIALLDAPPGPVEQRELAHLARLHHPEGLSHAPADLVDPLTDHFVGVSESLKVDWIHPSWRDLVIDELRRDGEARARFLERCTIEGVVLAISRGGGAAGERELALLIADRDWDLVTDRALALCAEASERDVVRLLQALAGAVEAGALAPVRERAELEALASATLGAASRRAHRHGGPVGVEVIGAWYALADLVECDAEPPGLGVTWTELLPGDGVDLRRPEELDRALAWLELAEILRRHAPEVLAAYGFPWNHRARVDALVSDAEGLVAAGGIGPLRPRLGEMLRMCRALVNPTSAELSRLDTLMWHVAEDTPPPDPDLGAIARGEDGLRRHVELILDDL